MNENPSKAPVLTLCLFLLLTIPLDRAVLAAVDIVCSRGLDNNWFFGMDHAFQSALVAIIPSFFGYCLFKHIEELKEEPANEIIAMKAIFAATFVILFTVVGYDFLSLAAETKGTLNTDTTTNLLLASLVIGVADGLYMAGFSSFICFGFIKKTQRELIKRKSG